MSSLIPDTIWLEGRPADVTLTPSIYWLSKHPAVQRLRTLRNEECSAEASRLADLGHQIDHAIMVWHWPPDITMYARLTAGYGWVPAANQNPIMGPVNFPGNVYDPNDPPPGSIKVSVDAKDYPPFEVPAPPPPVTAATFVGKRLYGNVYTYGPASISAGKYTVQHGQIVTQDNQEFTAKFVFGLFGPSLEYHLGEG